VEGSACPVSNMAFLAEAVHAAERIVSY